MKAIRMCTIIGYTAFVLMLCSFQAEAGTAKGDIDAINGVNLTDAMLCLQIMANLNPTVAAVIADADVNGDGRIGLEEAIYVLQVIAGLRSSGSTSDKGNCLSTEEKSLADMLNAYRNTNGLASVPVSKSLTAVAQWHVWDLETNPVSGSCTTLHSWSDKGEGLWQPLCYTSDTASYNGMWNKPKEISKGVYTKNGYEISTGYNISSPPGTLMTASVALNIWKGSSAHNSVILQQGTTWGNYQWKAMGVGIYGKYAVVWFGDTTDPQGTVTSQCP